MSKKQRIPLGEFLSRFGTEEDCRTYLAAKRWPDGFVCPKCGHRHGCLLSNGKYQCARCHRQTSVTAGTVMHHSHVGLTKWFLAIYFVSQDKRGISAIGLARLIGVTHKTAWGMLHRLRMAMGQRDAAYQLTDIVEFDDAYFGGPKVGSKRGRGTEKAKVFVALSLGECGNPRYLKLGVTPNIKQASVRKFAENSIRKDAVIRSDGYRSYIGALADYAHEHKKYDPNAGMLHWLHITISNAKAFILGTYHGLPQKYLQSYLDEFAFRFSRRSFGGLLTERLLLAVAASSAAY